MGEEYGAETPFLFFCDFEKDLASAVTEGRRNEFARFERFRDPAQREQIPDPAAVATFELSKLDWSALQQPRHQKWLELYRRLLHLRRQHIVPFLSNACFIKAEYTAVGDHGLTVRWNFSSQSTLMLQANLGPASLAMNLFPKSQLIYISEGVDAESLNTGALPAWSVAWYSA
jgi:1,4-alpha-glucan branching enzyme